MPRLAAAQAPPAGTTEQVPAGGVAEHRAEAARPHATKARDDAADAAAAAQRAAHKADLHRQRALKEGARADLAAQRQPRKPAAPPVSSPPTSDTSACMDVVEAQAAWRITCLPLTCKPGRAACAQGLSANNLQRHCRFACSVLH